MQPLFPLFSPLSLWQFMDLRTRYTALVTLTTQHVKYISDALRRLEEEEVRVWDTPGLCPHVPSGCCSPFGGPF